MISPGLKCRVESVVHAMQQTCDVMPAAMLLLLLLVDSVMLVMQHNVNNTS